MENKDMAFKHGETDTLSDNNLLAIFRVVTISRFIIAAIIYLILPTEVDELSRGRLLTLIDALLLAIYLSSGLLRRVLNRRYMPVGLVWAAIVPLLISSYSIYLFFTAPIPVQLQDRIEQLENVVVVSNIAQTLPILLIPLLIVSWRYPRRTVIQFCLGTSFLDIVVIVLFVQLNSTNLTIAFSLIVFRLIILSLVGLMVNQLVALHTTQARALRDANTRLRDYAATREHLITSQERNRLAREMHDTLAHALAASTVQLEAVQVIWDAQPERARQLVQESAATMRSGLQDTRRALQALRAEPLESVGFIASIHQLVESIQARYEANVTVDAPADVVWLSQDQEHIVYRIAQEALLNSAQHAQAQQITVELVETEQAIALSIMDDGTGFDPAAIDTHTHFGVQGMRERADMIGARLTVVSQSGQGTHIQMIIRREPDAHSNL